MIWYFILKRSVIKLYLNWNIENVKKGNRRSFIIECLQEYIKEVDNMDIRTSKCVEDIEICMISDFYKAVIEELSGGD